MNQIWNRNFPQWYVINEVKQLCSRGFPLARLWSLRIVFASAYVLRLFFAASFFHHFDLGTWLIYTSGIAEGKWNVYDPHSYPYPHVYGYPPAFLFATIYPVGVLRRVLNLGDMEQMFLIRAILSGFDLATGYLIYQLVYSKTGRPRSGLLACILFLFNPFVILVSSIWGMMDSVPTFFATSALLLHLRKRNDLSALSLSSAICAKSYPIYLLPCFLFLQPNLRGRMRYFLVATGLAAVLSAPFAISSPASYFYGSAIWELKRGDYFGIYMFFVPSTGWWDSPTLKLAISFVALICLTILLFRYRVRGRRRLNLEGTLAFYSAFVMLLYSTSMFHSQFLLLIAPVAAVYIGMRLSTITWASYSTLAFSLAMLFWITEWQIFSGGVWVTNPTMYTAAQLFNFFVPVASFYILIEMVRVIRRSLHSD